MESMSNYENESLCADAYQKDNILVAIKNTTKPLPSFAHTQDLTVSGQRGRMI